MNKKEKTVRNAEYYEKRAREEWYNMEGWATCGCEDECFNDIQKSKQAARRAVLYEMAAKEALRKEKFAKKEE